MKKTLLLLSATATFALTGCYGLKKVDFATFKDKVGELESIDTKSVKITGKIDGEKVSLDYDIPQTAGSIIDSALDAVSGKYNRYELEAIAVATATKTPSAYALTEDSNCKYYTGLGFKVVSKDGTIEWNMKGLLFSVKTDDTSLMFFWKKA